MAPRTEVIAGNIPDVLKDRVHFAAEKVGRAAAMVTNLQVSGSPHLEAWKAEQRAWSERTERAVAASALSKGPLAEYAFRIAGDNYQATVVEQLDYERAA